MTVGVRRSLLVGILLVLPALVFAQEAVLIGTVTDSTGGVLPGVTVTAVHEASGNTFVGVTDGRGIYRVPARIGQYQLTFELPGFSTVSRTGVSVLVGQTAAVDVQLSPSTLQETVTVTGEAPLLDVATSSVGGNIDQRQMQELPVQGRDWTALALLAPGNRTTTMGGTPVQDRADVREYQMNVDGQQVTQTMGIGGQPLYSRDAIAEFQFISNRFDATQGRSSGVQVNAVSKSGTNTFSGVFTGTFRDSDWNAEDHVLNRVIPFSNQQFSTAVGGPVLRDRLHFFGNFEYDRTPRTSIWNTPFPHFNISLEGVRTKRFGGTRLDYQISPSMRLMGKAHWGQDKIPFGDPNATQHPASSNKEDRTQQEYLGQFTQVLNNRALNEIKAGFAGWQILQENLTTWSNHWQKHLGITEGHPRVQMVGFSVAGNQNAPRVRDQNMFSLRDDFTLSYEARGRHDLKAGGEWLYLDELTRNCRNCMSQLDARVSAVPAALMPQIFPDAFNVDTWNLALLTPYTRAFTLGVSETFLTPFQVPRTAAWVQDDWHISNRVTLNLGLRYDLISNAWANDAEILPFLEGGRPNDTNNIQPRLGFAWSLDDRTVVRGGFGRYFGDILSNLQMWTYGNETIASVRVTPDGRPDFAARPFPSGVAPTPDQAFAGFCSARGLPAGTPGCLVRDLQELAPPPDYAQVQNSWQTSIGVQRQFGTVMAIEADYVYNGSRNEKIIMDNINVSYNPVTGANFPFSNIAARPYPSFGVVSMTPYLGWSNYHALQTALTKRFADNWQGSVTYTLGWLKNSDSNPLSGIRLVDFDVAPDLGEDYTLAETDQRNRVVFNGIWQPGFGFQVSGVYFYGSGERLTTTYGGELRNLGATGTDRLRPDGSIVPRNGFVGDSVQRLDMRLQQRVPLGGRMTIDGIFEVFNLFDRANFGSYTTNESSSAYGEPDQNANLAYAPRTLQMGFRFTF